MSALERYLDNNRMHSFEGVSGVRKFEKLVGDVGGYRNVYEFLEDNPGAIDAMVEFVTEWSGRNADWRDNLESLVGEDEEEDEEDEDCCC